MNHKNQTILFIFLMVFLIGCSITGETIRDIKVHCLKGDVDEDGKIDEDDLMIIDAYLKKDIDLNHDQIRCVDIDGNLDIDTNDRKLLVERINEVAR